MMTRIHDRRRLGSLAMAIPICLLLIAAATPARADVDSDGDGIADAVDNCPARRNHLQRDRDGDGIGNACDTCWTVPNPDQDPAACACPCFTAEDLDELGSDLSVDVCSLRELGTWCMGAKLARVSSMIDTSAHRGVLGPVRHYVALDDRGRPDPEGSYFSCSFDFADTCEATGGLITRREFRACNDVLAASRPWRQNGCPR